MQLSTKPEIQIHIRGAGLIQLHFAGRCVGFAVTYRSAGHKANRLEQVLLSMQKNRSEFAVDRTAEVSFSSDAPSNSISYVTSVASEVWVVEAADGTPIRAFTSRRVADWFKDTLEAYDRLMPPSGENGEWSDAQIAWFRNHPAPIASACGGSFQVRNVEVH